jgi:hypothetical protein
MSRAGSRVVVRHVFDPWFPDGVKSYFQQKGLRIRGWRSPVFVNIPKSEAGRGNNLENVWYNTLLKGKGVKSDSEK